MELKRDTVDVDRWVDRHVGWHFVLLLLGIVGGFFLGMIHAQKKADERIYRLNVEFNSSIDARQKQRAEDRAKLHAAELAEMKARLAAASCDKRASEWERRAREKGE